MKSKLFTICLFGCLIFNSVQAQWVSQNSGVVTSLFGVSFTDILNGIAVGDSGLVLKTNTGGNSWSIVRAVSGTNNSLLGVTMVNGSTGFAVGVAGTILSTSNGGTNWASQNSGTTNNLNSVFFINTNTGWAAGLGGTLIKTINGGNSWFSSSAALPDDFYCVNFIDANTGFATGANNALGTVYFTSNGGANWTVQSNPTPNGDIILCLAHTTGSTLVGGTQFGGFIITTDFGNNWSDISDPDPSHGDVNSMSFGDANHGAAVGSVGTSGAEAWNTVNGGNTWNEQVVTQALGNIFAVSMANINIGWAVGVVGEILKTTDGGAIGIKKISNTVPVNFTLSQNFPNPFNPTTNIKFDIAKTSDVGITVYDILGKEVEVIVNQNLKPGSYETNWNASKYSSGVYFYRLSAGSFVQTKKMILTK
jgi:photosystem II stability/assembly factor-like uncharacterized protein